MRDFLCDLIELLKEGFLTGLRIFALVAFVLLIVSSLFLTLVLLCVLCEGKPAAWYEIAAPIVLFMGIGLFIAYDE